MLGGFIISRMELVPVEIIGERDEVHKMSLLASLYVYLVSVDSCILLI